MELSFAPMEGVTYAGYRRIHAKLFGGADRYYAPFIAPNGDGTYKISFSLKEEVNAEPTPADTLVPPSAHGAVMQPMAFKDIKTEVDNVVSKVPGVSVDRFELIYRECVFSCVYNPQTDEVKSITHNIVIDIVAKAKVFSADIDGTARLTNDMLIYNITW
jgi:hypothetical protein